jgi:hypothetical protein
VFIAMGITLGYIAPPALGLVTLTGLITITLSTYMILHSQALYARLSPWLKFFERRHPHREASLEKSQQATGRRADVMLFGAGRFGMRLLEKLQENGFSVLVVDFNPVIAEELRRAGVPVYFGDAGDADFVETLPLQEVKWAVSALPDESVNTVLPEMLRKHGFSGGLSVAMRGMEDTDLLMAYDVDHLIRPYSDAADHAANHIMQSLDAGRHGEAPPGIRKGKDRS